MRAGHSPPICSDCNPRNRANAFPWRRPLSSTSSSSTSSSSSLHLCFRPFRSSSASSSDRQPTAVCGASVAIASPWRPHTHTHTHTHTLVTEFCRDAAIETSSIRVGSRWVPSFFFAFLPSFFCLFFLRESSEAAPATATRATRRRAANWRRRVAIGRCGATNRGGAATDGPTKEEGADEATEEAQHDAQRNGRGGWQEGNDDDDDDDDESWEEGPIMMKADAKRSDNRWSATRGRFPFRSFDFVPICRR